MTSEHKKQIANLRVAFKYYQTLKPKYEREMAEKKKKRLRLFITAFVCCFVVRGVAYLYLTRNQIFLELCRIGTPEEVKAAIARNIWDVNMKVNGVYGFFDGRTISPYILAARENRNPEVLQVLEQAGAKADKNKALEIATDNDRLEIVKFLVKNGATNQNYALEQFAYRGNMDMVKFLLQSGATDKNVALERAVHGENIEIAKFLIQSGAEINWYALWRELPTTARKMIKKELKPQFEQVIISVARKYGFEIVADENKRKNGKRPDWKRFSEKILAQEDSVSGCVYFCTDSFYWQKGYILFPPDTFYYREYSNISSYRDIAALLDIDTLSGSLSDRAFNALRELCD